MSHSQAVKSDIRKGRPYGGVAFLIRNNIACKVKCIYVNVNDILY